MNDLPATKAMQFKDDISFGTEINLERMGSFSWSISIEIQY
jgi:hypothetical protein